MQDLLLKFLLTMILVHLTRLIATQQKYFSRLDSTINNNSISKNLERIK